MDRPSWFPLDGGELRGLSRVQVMKHIMGMIDSESPPKPFMRERSKAEQVRRLYEGYGEAVGNPGNRTGLF